eukprot:scaffold6963_cov110-Isochrysis_galbana.AAC.6
MLAGASGAAPLDGGGLGGGPEPPSPPAPPPPPPAHRRCPRRRHRRRRRRLRRRRARKYTPALMLAPGRAPRPASAPREHGGWKLVSRHCAAAALSSWTSGAWGGCCTVDSCRQAGHQGSGKPSYCERPCGPALGRGLGPPAGRQNTRKYLVAHLAQHWLEALKCTGKE